MLVYSIDSAKSFEVVRLIYDKEPDLTGYMLVHKLCFTVKRLSRIIPWYFNKVVSQIILRSDVSAILKSIHVLEIVREFVWVKQ